MMGTVMTCPICQQDAEIQAVSFDVYEETRITDYSCSACGTEATAVEDAERWELEPLAEELGWV